MTAFTASQLHLAPTVIGDRVTVAVHTLAVVCPAAPPGMQAYQDQVISWVKWGVIGLILIAGFVSIGAIVLGKTLRIPHASVGGAIGLVVTVMAAILFVTAPGMINGIVGSGC